MSIKGVVSVADNEISKSYGFSQRHSKIVGFEKGALRPQAVESI